LKEFSGVRTLLVTSQVSMMWFDFRVYDKHTDFRM